MFNCVLDICYYIRIYLIFIFFFAIQVNGTRVTHCTHVDVVNLIKCKFAFIYFYYFDIKSQRFFLLLHMDEKRKEKPNVCVCVYQ